MDHTFEVGKVYRNRNGDYEVLSIQEPEMRIRYKDAHEDVVIIAIQAQIWEELQREKQQQNVKTKRTKKTKKKGSKLSRLEYEGFATSFSKLKGDFRSFEANEVNSFINRFMYLKESFEPVHIEILAKKQEATRVEAPDFNVFRILGVEHLEDNTHSPLLAELLDPQGSHGQGALFLRAFLEIFRDGSYGEFPLPEEEIDDHGWQISREMFVGNGFLDIVIRNDEMGCLYVIENKIDAPEQPKQLRRYQQWLGKQTRYPKRAIIFLTPTGREPKSGNAFCLSYQSDITNWLEQLLNSINAARVAETVHQYLAIFSPRGKKTMGYEDEVLKFLVKPENITTALEIAGYVENLKSRTHWQFWNRMNRYLNEPYQVSEYRNKWGFLEMLKKNVNASYRGCHFIPKSAINSSTPPCLQFCFRQHDLNDKGTFYFGIRWNQSKEWLKEYSSPEFFALLEQLREQGFESNLSYYWPAWRWLDFSPFSESFYIDMVNKPESFVKELAKDYWRLFVDNVEAVEAVNLKVAADAA